ncbi:MAG TPA: hypothetical protein VMS74_10305 [Acidimicrobiia bacterium]|nr:hypothetical protein [Acidimicrobiia bacterium]
MLSRWPVVPPWFRLGYIVPHLAVDMDPYQFYRVAPDGVMLVTVTLDLKGYEREFVVEETEKLSRAVDVLVAAKADVISLSGVPIGATLGRERTRALVAEMAAQANVRAATDFEAHVNALQHLGVSRVALATRWPPELVEGVRRYLGEAGIEVVSVASRPRNLDQNKRADPRADHELALALGRKALAEGSDAQALLMPGGLWFAIHAATDIESEFDVPVLLNITSTLWDALRLHPAPLPVRPEPRWGRLLASL